MRINKSFIALTSSDASVSWSNITGTPTTLSGYGITDGVPTSRTLTINGTTYDLSANRTWTVSDTNIYTTDGTLTGLRNVTLSGYSLTFTGSATTTVIHSSGRLLLGGATDSISFVMNATGSVNISNSLNVGVRIDATTIIANTNVQGFFVRATSYFSLGLIASISAPSVGNGFLYGKNDKKIYWKNSDGTEYDLTTGSGGTVTSVGLSSATSGVTIGSTPVTTSGTITLTIATASGSQQGLLSSTDWTTFNNKQNALTNPVTGTGTTNYIPKWTSSSALGDSGLISDSNNNLGLGVVPSAWGSGYTALQILNLSLFGTSGLDLNLGSNVYYDGTNYKYISNGFASLYNQFQGKHYWSTVGSGTAGNAITFTQAMTLTANGRLLLGTTTEGSELLQVNGTSRFTGNITIDDTGTAVLSAQGNVSTNFFINSRSTLTFQTGGAYGSSTTRMTIGSTGNVTISNLAGTGTRMVVADSSGVLSTQTITTTTSGTYTPTLTSVANISSSSPELSTYTRVGDIVAVQGYLTLTPTSASLTTTIGISLPIASNFNAGTDASGIFVSTSNDRFGGITPDQTNDRVEISFTSSSNGTRSFYFSFQYQIK